MTRVSIHSTTSSLLRLRTDWTVDGKTFPGGALLAADFEAYLRGDRQTCSAV